MAKELNTNWMFDTFCKLLTATKAGTYLVLDSTWPEVKELKKLTYIQAKPSLLKEGNNVAFVAQKDATAEDLINDLELDHAVYLPKIPAEIKTMSQENTPVVPAAPTPDVAEAAVPVVPVVPAAPVADVAVAVAEAPVVPAAPTFHAETNEVAQTTTTAVSDAATPAVIGQGDYQVVDTVERRGKTIAIELGVAYHKPVPTLPQGARAAGQEVYPYAELVQLKKEHPESAPSFHLVGKASKDVSGLIKRHAMRYEESDGITFRVNKVDATDPLGEGVRVYALFVSEAPARRKPRTKAAATAE